MPETGLVELGVKARAQLEAGRWVQAATLFRKLEKSTSLSPRENVYYGVALTNLNEVDKALNRFTDTALASSNRRRFVRRRAVVPQLQSRNYANAEAVLQRLLEIAPDNVANLGSLATVFLREERDTEALGCLKKAYTLNPDSTALRGRLLQTYIRMEDVTGACEFALAEKHRWHEDLRFAQSSAVVLLDADRTDEALGAADAIIAAEAGDASATAVAARVYLQATQPKRALEVCRTALHAKTGTAEIRYIMALACNRMAHDSSIAMHHLRAGLACDANHVQSARMLGRLLIEAGDFKSAIPVLQDALRMEPDRMAIRIDLARTFHVLGRRGDAADAFSAALRDTDKPESWTPMAVSALIAAGRTDEAEAEFAVYRKRKAKGLPKTLACGLQELADQEDGTDTASERLDWAWTIAGHPPGKQAAADRAAWRRAALWGHGADALISDWAQCRPHRHRELADLIDIGDRTRRLIQRAMSRGKGAIIATAHMGPLASAPFALQKLGVPYRWLAPVPHISPVNRMGALISTHELPSLDITFQFFQALARGFAVAVAVDGATDPSAPTMTFEGRKIPYSDFAARAAYRHQVTSFFAMPRWRDRRIEWILKPMPAPQRNEPLEPFLSRWADAYRAHLKNGFALPPENLRMRGGLWRSMR